MDTDIEVQLEEGALAILANASPSSGMNKML